MKKLLLGVNIDHVATLRQARNESFPDIIRAAKICESSGADQITVHLREDRRHIQDKDVIALKNVVKKLNLEMACSREIEKIALKIKPYQATLVPEKRREITTEGGLDVVKNFSKISSTVEALNKKGIFSSLFIDPEFDQIEMSVRTGASRVELHTGSFANAKTAKKKEKELLKLMNAAAFCNAMGLIVNAGHGIDYKNVDDILKIPNLHELNIGFCIIAESVFVGLDKAVKDMRKLIKGYKLLK